MTITKDIIALAEKIDSAQEWDMDDCKALCEALDMGDEWEAADGETFEPVVEKAVEAALKADEKKEVIVAEIEEREDGIVCDIASDLAAQANAWLKEVDD